MLFYVFSFISYLENHKTLDFSEKLLYCFPSTAIEGEILLVYVCTCR